MSILRRALAAMAAGALMATAAPALAQGKVLKFVQNGNLTILDPIWTTAVRMSARRTDGRIQPGSRTISTISAAIGPAI